MGLLSPTVSITQYRVEGQLPSPVNENVTTALKKNTINEIDNDASEQAIGWTSFDNPYQPDFEGSQFVIDTVWVFSLRIDKKSIPTKVLKKHYNMEIAQRLAEPRGRLSGHVDSRPVRRRRGTFSPDIGAPSPSCD